MLEEYVLFTLVFGGQAALIAVITWILIVSWLDALKPVIRRWIKE